MNKLTKPMTRDQKLAAKLKENLRRRKAQARARANDSAQKTEGDPSPSTIADSNNTKP